MRLQRHHPINGGKRHGETIQHKSDAAQQPQASLPGVDNQRILRLLLLAGPPVQGKCQHQPDRKVQASAPEKKGHT